MMNRTTLAADPGDHSVPMDEHDARLAANVCPPDWTNPVPAGRYQLVVVGAGTAGLVAAAAAAGLGAKVALVERDRMGGDCLNFGCVPSKAMISATIHPYPTLAESIRKLGDQYNRARLTPWVAWAIGKWLAWTR